MPWCACSSNGAAGGLPEAGGAPERGAADDDDDWGDFEGDAGFEAPAAAAPVTQWTPSSVSAPPVGVQAGSVPQPLAADLFSEYSEEPVMNGEPPVQALGLCYLFFWP